MAIVLSVLLWFTDYDYPFGIFWPLCCLSFDLRIMIIPLVSFGHCVVCPSSIYGLWLSLWYLLAIVLSVLLWFTDYDYPFSIFGHCVVCPSLIYGLWLSLWYLLAIVLSVLLWFTDYDYPFGIFWPLCCLSFFDLRIMIIPLVSLAIVLSVIWFTDYDYPFGIFWPLYCLSFFDLRIMIIPLVSFGHCVVCPSLIYGLWLSLWYLLAIVLSVLWFTDYDYPFSIFWPLCCLSFFDLRIMIIPLVSFGHCVVCPLIYGLWLSL